MGDATEGTEKIPQASFIVRAARACTARCRPDSAFARYRRTSMRT